MFCVCACICLCTQVCIKVCMCVSVSADTGVFLSNSSPYFLGQSLSLSLELSRAGSVIWQEAQDSAHLCFPSPGITGVSGHSGFSDLHTSAAST